MKWQRDRDSRVTNAVQTVSTPSYHAGRDDVATMLLLGALWFSSPFIGEEAIYDNKEVKSSSTRRCPFKTILEMSVKPTKCLS
jgi:hypothetical protein